MGGAADGGRDVGRGGGGGEEGAHDGRFGGTGMAVEADGELEVSGLGGTQCDDVGGDAGIGVILAGDRVASDGAVLGGPDAEREPASPAVALTVKVDARE